MKQPTATYPHLPITDLFDELEKYRQFDLTTEHRIWVNYTISEVAKTGEFKRLANLLCPLIAQSPEQQQLFHSVFNKLFLFEIPDIEQDTDECPESRDKKDIAPKKEPKLPQKATQKPTLQKRIKQWWNSRKTTQSKTPITKVQPKKTETEKIAPKLIDEQLPDEVWMVGQPTVRINWQPQLRTALQQMRRREFDELQELDITKTISKTIDKRGIFSPVFTKRTRTTEYLFLIEKNHPNSHTAAYANELAKTLQWLDVTVNVFYFSGLPYYCHNRRFPKGLKLETVESRFSKAVLIVFSPDFTGIFNSKGNFIPLAKILKRWQRRILISSIPTGEWDYRHVILRKLFPVVLPDNARGIAAMTMPYELLVQNEKAKPDYWKRMSGFWDSTIFTNHNLPVEHILVQYPEAFYKRWVAACTVWPELRWKLSLQIGKWLHEQDSDQTETRTFPTVEDVNQLTRNQWFQEGYIPQHQRRLLQKHLTESDKKFIARKIVETFRNQLKSSGVADIDKALLIVSLKEIAQRLSPEKQQKLKQRLSKNLAKNRIVALQYMLPDIMDLEIDLSSLNPVFEQMLNEAAVEFEEWETEMKSDALPEKLKTAIYNTKGGDIIKSWNFENGILEINFCKDFKELREINPTGRLTEEEYYQYFDSGEHINIILMGTPVKLMRDFEMIDRIKISFPFKKIVSHINISRSDVEQYFNIRLADLKGNNEKWTSEITDKFLDNRNERMKFADRFIKQISYTVFEDKQSDAPIKAQTSQSILVAGTFTIKEFEQFFSQYTNDLKKRKSKYHDEQTHLFLYFFDKESRATSNWFARYELINNQKENFHYNNDLLQLFANDNNTYTVTQNTEQQIIKYNSVLEMFEAKTEYSITNGTLRQITGFEYHISEKHVENEDEKYIIENVKRSLIQAAYEVFIFTNAEEISLTSIPLQIDLKNEKESHYRYNLAKSIKIKRNEALKILQEKAGVNDFEQLVETYNYNFYNRYFNGMLYNDSGKPTLDVIWKEFEKYAINSPGWLNSTANSQFTPPQTVFVKGATFLMGSEYYYYIRNPIHKVTVSDFYMAEKPVTQKLYKDITGKNPSRFKDCPDCPVENVTWYDAVEFCNALSEKAGLPPAYDTKHRLIDAEGRQTNDITKVKGYRLPTEAEWEYAAGGGQKSGMKSEDGIIKLQEYAGTNYEFELGDYAWYYENSYDLGKDHKNYGTNPVGQKKPNELGLYDMSGNVWEWCNDWYDDDYYKNSSEKNPTGPESGSARVLRGGRWRSHAKGCRSANRSYGTPTFSRDYIGFRPARTVSL